MLITWNLRLDVIIHVEKKLRAKAPLYVPDEEVKWKRDKI
jgi:hypothetical protein